MNRKQVQKEIREIAMKLPPIKEEHVSGYDMVDIEGGLKRPQAHHYLTDVNHERRLRRAYEKFGMEGIKHYLNQIHQLQLQRNEEISKQADSSKAD